MPDEIDKVLDDTCGLFYAHDSRAGARPTRLYVSPEVYQAIVRARRRDVDRGVPLLVLDLDLASDPSLNGAEVRVA